MKFQFRWCSCPAEEDLDDWDQDERLRMEWSARVLCVCKMVRLIRGVPIGKTQVVS